MWTPILKSFLERVLTKLGCAVLFAVMLTIAANGTVSEGLRYVALLCLLISFSLFGVAFTRRRSFDLPSEWDEGFVFSFLASRAHFMAPLF